MSEDELRRFSLFPKTLAEALQPVTKPVLKTQGLAGSNIVSQWEHIVGEGLAKVCTPEALSFPRGQKTGGTLTISCQNGFATEVLHVQPMILERLASYFGYQAVSRIVISHSWQPPLPPPAPKARTPLPASAMATLDEVDDPELKAALTSLAHTISGQK